MSDVVLSERRGPVLFVRLNRPDKLNALNDEMAAALIAAFDAAKLDPGVRAVVLGGTGRGFCAGQDLEAFVAMRSAAEPVSVAEHLKRGYNVIVTQIRSLEKPVIAALGGVAAGVGLSLALACDLRIAADDAKLTLGFSKIGLIPDGGASLMLPVLAGFGRALELAWTSDVLSAPEAERSGLVNRVVPAADLETEALAYAERLAAMSPVAIALTKHAFNRAMLPHLGQWLGEEANLQEEAANGPDLREGVDAFLNKRRPAFAAR